MGRRPFPNVGHPSHDVNTVRFAEYGGREKIYLSQFLQWPFFLVFFSSLRRAGTEPRQLLTELLLDVIMPVA